MNGLVHLVRHGSHDEVGKVLSGRSAIGLSAVGRAECARLARRLARMEIAAIHASPRRRTLETAELVAGGRPVEPVDALDEIDFGDWAGQGFAALDGREDWRRWNAERGAAATPAGDTMAAVAARAVRHLEDAEGEGPLLCVTHADVIRGVVAHYLQLGGQGLMNFDVDPASLTTLSLYPGGGRVVSLNERVGGAGA